MKLLRIRNLDRSIGDLISELGPGGGLIEAHGTTRYAVIPVDDELLDLLIERDPSFSNHCKVIRTSMNAGQFHTHEEVRKRFG
jgi:hypothetical protein